LFILLTVAVVVLVAVNQPVQAGTGVVLLLLGLPAYAFFVSRLPGAERASRGVH
jgi:hypothetical protein